MSRKTQPWQLFTLLITLLSVTCACNLPLFLPRAGLVPAEPEVDPGQAEAALGEQTPPEAPAPLAVVDETYSPEVNLLVSEFNADPATAGLMQALAEDSYQVFLESADVRFDNGMVMRSLEATNGANNQLLARFELPNGEKEALVFATPASRTLDVWDETGGFRLAMNDDGSLEIFDLDTQGHLLPNNAWPMAEKVRAHFLPPALPITQQDVCISYGLAELRDCLGSSLLTVLAVPACATIFGAILAGTAGTGWALASVIVGLIASCGTLADCLAGSVSDDPPRAVIDTMAIEKPAIRRCQEFIISTGALYKIKVKCEDDRKPNPVLVNPAQEFFSLVAGESTPFGLCKDCKGQIGGMITNPKQSDNLEILPVRLHQPGRQRCALPDQGGAGIGGSRSQRQD